MAQQLTARQLQIALLICDGLTNEEIADRLLITPRTVKMHSDQIRMKLGAPNKRRIPERMRELGMI